MDKPRITIEEFSNIEVKVGTVISAERVPETDKLLRLMVDFGLKPATAGSADQPLAGVGEERDVRQIVSGIAAYVSEPESLVGRQLSFVTNLEPRVIRGLESNGMLFAVGEGDSFAFITPDRPIPPGTSAH
jgi:methionyl-tRNA synthetase